MSLCCIGHMPRPVAGPVNCIILCDSVPPHGQAQWLRYYAYFKDREVEERQFGLLPGSRSSKSGSQERPWGLMG